MPLEETPPAVPPSLPPSTKDLLARLAAHEEWTKQQVADIMTKLAPLPPAEQKKAVEKIEEKVAAKEVVKESGDIWDEVFGA
jgi:hypothetical protein